MFFLFFFPDTLYFGELNEKIRLLYCLHIPPGYSLCEYDDELLSSTLMSAIYWFLLRLFASAALTETEDDPSVMKSPLLSTNRPLYVNLPPRQCKHAPSSRYCTYQGDLLVRLKNSLSCCFRWWQWSDRLPGSAEADAPGSGHREGERCGEASASHEPGIGVACSHLSCVNSEFCCFFVFFRCMKKVRFLTKSQDKNMYSALNNQTNMQKFVD